MIHSMTGFSTKTATLLGEPYKIELKSLNHRFLDLKLRMPRSFSVFEAQIKSLIEKKLNRGSVEVWIERASASKTEALFQINDEAADAAFKALSELRNRFQISETVSLKDIVTFPEVVEKNGGGPKLTPEMEKTLGAEILKLLAEGVEDLATMREQEGSKLKTALLHIVSDLKSAHGRLMTARSQIQKNAQAKIKKRVEQCFEAYATTDEKLRALMETRIAQEIIYAMEKLDIEEELTRFKGHVDQIEALLVQGGQVGKKLDFMFQELNREINTLGNKAQDLGVSQDVIDLKMKIEQMREQSLNLE